MHNLPFKKGCFIFSLLLIICLKSYAFARDTLHIPLGKSEIIHLPEHASRFSNSHPKIAEISLKEGKKAYLHAVKEGETTLQFLNNKGKIIHTLQLYVISDLPDAKRTLKTLFPHENIGIEKVNHSIALLGEVSSAEVASQALRVVEEFIRNTENGKNPEVINLMKVRSGQQVMLRVRVGEVNRTAAKNIGLNLTGAKAPGHGGKGTGVDFTTSGFVSLADTLSTGIETATGGSLTAKFLKSPLNLTAKLQLLEQDGLMKILAEPNLVAISGESAEFLAGGEFPIPVPQGDRIMSIIFKKFGVSVQFTPYVLSSDRIRLKVEPEVSELTRTGSTNNNGTYYPGISTRRAQTTVELAPGESFMVAGLIRDDLSTIINEIPGFGDIPILGALLRSSQFQRKETELVIAVTPYLVDPVVGSDIHLPTDNFKAASTLDMVFFGALSGHRDSKDLLLQTGNIEGPSGLMVE